MNWTFQVDVGRDGTSNSKRANTSDHWALLHPSYLGVSMSWILTSTSGSEVEYEFPDIPADWVRVPPQPEVFSRYLETLRGLQSRRPAYFAEVLARCGAGSPRQLSTPEHLDELYSYLKDAIPRWFAPYKGGAWYKDSWVGIASLATRDLPWYDGAAEGLSDALGFDLAFFVTGLVQAARPGTDWCSYIDDPIVALSGRRGNQFVPVIDSDLPVVSPLVELPKFVSRVLSARYDEETAEQEEWLLKAEASFYRLYRRLMKLDPPNQFVWSEHGLGRDESEAEGDSRTAPMWTEDEGDLWPRERLKRPRGRKLTGLPALERAVAALREAGFLTEYQSWSVTEIAVAAARFAPEQALDITDHDQAIWTLLIADGSRSLYFDIECDFYLPLVRALAARSGGALKLRNLKEEVEGNEFVVRGKSGRDDIEMHFPLTDGYVGPSLVYEVNRLLGDEIAFYHLDTGGQVALVVRASLEERERLRELAGVELLEEAPAWWTD